MTPAEGFGMLAMGLIAIAIGAMVAFYVINKVAELEKREKDDQDWDRRFR
tara:strand:- start:204 stop:353 length:150 start_codon:yes stop_codon:yes gene_type:complete